MCSSHRFRIKGDPPGEGTAAQAWKGEKGQVIQGVGVRENKSWVQFFLHVPPTPRGSGVFFSLFTECVDAAFTTIPGQFAAKSPRFIGLGQTKKGAVLQRKQFSFTFFSFIESLVLLTRVITRQGISPCLFVTAVIFGCLNPGLLYCWNKIGKSTSCTTSFKFSSKQLHNSKLSPLLSNGMLSWWVLLPFTHQEPHLYFLLEHFEIKSLFNN